MDEIILAAVRQRGRADATLSLFMSRSKGKHFNCGHHFAAYIQQFGAYKQWEAWEETYKHAFRTEWERVIMQVEQMEQVELVREPLS